jgi:pimeloyl-ACP methyl ester carboxylesterase
MTMLGGILVAGLCALVYPKYHHDIQAARERVSAGSKIAETLCGPIEYAVSGEGRPLLVVHGAGGGWDQGMDFAEPLAPSGFSLVAMSRFGYLRTPLPRDASAAAQADAHACLLDTLQIPAAAVIGISAGAPSSMQLALRHPDRVSALVLVVPAAWVADTAPPLKTPAVTEFLFSTALRSDLIFWAAVRIAREAVLRGVLATPPDVVAGAGAAEQQRVAEVLAHILPVSSRRPGLLNDAAVTSSIERYELERIETPTLALSAADDLFGTFDTARYTAQHIPGARFVGYESGGHVLVGRQEHVMREITSFIRAQSARNKNVSDCGKRRSERTDWTYCGRVPRSPAPGS